jgi:hypothetical protein
LHFPAGQNKPPALPASSAYVPEAAHNATQPAESPPSPLLACMCEPRPDGPATHGGRTGRLSLNQILLSYSINC